MQKKGSAIILVYRDGENKESPPNKLNKRKGKSKMLYKAIVKHKETKEFTIIESESKSKKQFISDLRYNGYMVNINKVKKADLFDWIINNTNCQPMDWKLKSIPKDQY